MARTMGRPTTGVFLAWDEEAVDVERRDAGTVHDRTVVTARRMVTRYALWSNKISDRIVASAEAYANQNRAAQGERYGYVNLRVETFTAKNRRPI